MQVYASSDVENLNILLSIIESEWYITYCLHSICIIIVGLPGIPTSKEKFAKNLLSLVASFFHLNTMARLRISIHRV